MSRKVSVFLIHPVGMVRETLRRMLGLYERIEVVGESVSVGTALPEVMNLSPDVFIVDANESGVDGREPQPEITISIARDQMGRPLVNLTTYKETAPPSDLVIVGRYNKSRIQAFDMGPEGCRVTENTCEEIATAIMMAAVNKPSPRALSRKASGNGSQDSAQVLDTDKNNREGSQDGSSLASSSSKKKRSSSGKTGADSGANGGEDAIALLQNKRIANGLFGAVSVKLVEKTPASGSEDVTSPDEDSLLADLGLPEGTKINRDLAIHWERAEETEDNLETVEEDQPVEESPTQAPPLPVWEEPASDNKDHEEEQLVEVELVMASGLLAKDLYDFILRLRTATKCEIAEIVGTKTDGTLVKVQFHPLVPLMELLNEMPEVAAAKPDLSLREEGNSQDSSSSQLPKKIWIELKAYDEPKQLSMSFESLVSE